MDSNINRVTTDVPGLDRILGGGLYEGGVYIFQGPPGAGKTTLANQICFNAWRRQQRSVYVTMLAESHARMMLHMQRQTFFDPDAVPDWVTFISGYRAFETSCLKGVLELVGHEVSEREASLLVLDGLVLAGDDSAGRTDQLRRFVHELQSLASMLQCTVLILSSNIGRPADAETTMVDGVFTLDDRLTTGGERVFRVRKFRGCRVERGWHSFCITDDGLRFFPRLETIVEPATEPAPRTVESTGVAALDRCFAAGGIEAGSALLLCGPAGTGKTGLGLDFLAVGQAPALMYGFGQGPAAFRRLIGAAGLDVDRVRLHWPALDERQSPDELAHRLLELIDRDGVRRLYIDGLSGFAVTPEFAGRGLIFVTALLQALERRGVTTLAAVDPNAWAAAGVGWPAQALAACFDVAWQLSADDNGDVCLRVGKTRQAIADLRPKRLLRDGRNPRLVDG